jgi:hypothetical protein
MQKVVGSNPISRFVESPTTVGLFRVTSRYYAACARAVRSRPLCLAA